MEIKYLSDGRKVVVVGQLNQTETIVQEVFVTEAGDELPGGERFVTKSLHDVPVESWYSREVNQITQKIKDAQVELKRVHDQITESKSRLRTSLKISESVRQLSTALESRGVESFCDILTGKMKFAVVGGGHYPENKEPHMLRLFVFVS
ncbi:hypothetical protein ACJ5X2_003857 [Klebsiella quasipneumoniae]|uniref:hypothetical protein n=1 Tax=Klebsiella TaxID=570 RepID=UPI00069E795A|nr:MULTISPECIES: hypothetical protein [Klebsiella]QBL52259.1 hypothetical protein BMD99_027835 [Klebsiella sp. PO552]QLT68276.1 hypothetical protein HV202_31420 [Klebsiella oxytoca]HCI6032477.1 hypothetical protein [Klebsiella quasipneumoniae subsp. quasipneumoniae]EIW8528400.1 hypothetical protein [Klebsiella pneumoniae]MCX2317313.1 hypothetical protein [Klebsiella quasipneumoniae]